MSVHFDQILDFDCRFIHLTIQMEQNESAVIFYCIARTMMSKDSRLFPVVFISYMFCDDKVKSAGLYISSSKQSCNHSQLVTPSFSQTNNSV